LGVIDTLSAGFALINRRPWLMVIPVILDVLLWLGPVVSVAPLVDRLPDAWYDAATSLSNQGLESSVSREELGQARDEIRSYTEQLGQVNLLSLLALQMPSLMTGSAVSSPLGAGVQLSMDSLALVLLVVAALSFGSLLIASLFLAGIGIYVRGDAFRLRLYLRRSLINWGRLILLYVIVLIALAVLGMPVAMIAILASALSKTFGGLILGLLLAAMLWAALYLFYSLAAMFVGDVNPVLALWHSFNIVRYNLGPAMGLAVLVVIIGQGIGIALRFVLGNPLLVSAAIIGNAYVGAGLAAAAMIFYRERYAIWQKKVRSGKQVVEMTK